MIIKQLEMKNFRSHVDTKLDLLPLTFIRGTNASGKSSLEQAIEITLASHAEGTTADGKGAANLVRMGADKAHLSVTVFSESVEQGPRTRMIEATLKDKEGRTVLVTDPNNPDYAGGKEWANWLAKHSKVISSLVNNRFFVDLDQDGQKELLAAIILPTEYEWPEWVKPLCNGAKLPINWAAAPFEVIKQGYDLAFKARTGINRAVKEHTIPTMDTEEPSLTDAEIREKLYAFSSRMGDLNRERGVLIGSSTGDNATRKAAKERVALASDRMTKARAEVADATEATLPASKLKDLKKIAANLKKVQELDARIATLGAEYEIAKKAQDSLNKIKEGEGCPTCKRPYTEEDIKALAGPLLEAKNKTNLEREAAIDERKKLGDPEGAQRTLDAQETLVKDRDRAAATLRDESQALQDAEDALERLGAEKMVDTSDVDAKIADMEERIGNGTTALVQRQAYDSKLKAITLASEKKSALDKEQKDLERLVAYFEKDVRNELLSKSVGEFTAKMNEVLSGWGYRCRLSFDPFNFSIAFTGGDKEYYLPLRFLSKSQRYRFAAAFQVALAIVSGFRFVVLDELDIYDSLGRRLMLQALKDAGLDQVIILATDERDKVPNVEGSVFYQFTDVSEPGTIPTTTVRRLEPARE